jgi:prevent-host-death family protein
MLVVQNAHWQVQEAKQRFSALLRAVEREGSQLITRHGEVIAVMLPVEEYRRLTEPTPDFKEHLKAFPKMEVDEPDIWDEILAARKLDVDRPVDLGTFDDFGEVR